MDRYPYAALPPLCISQPDADQGRITLKIKRAEPYSRVS